MINRNDLLAGTRPEVGSKILVTEMEHFEGYQVMEYKGMVWGISMRSKDIGQDIFMSCKQLTGGELSAYTELSDEARQKALDRMLSSARRIGANAVINFKFEKTAVGATGETEVIAYGNAVVISPIRNYVPTGGLGNILAEFVDAFAESRGITTKEPTAAVTPTKTKTAEILSINEINFAVCPHCKMKYRLIKNENGEYRVKDTEDFDPSEEGYQIHCMNCGEKFTIPSN